MRFFKRLLFQFKNNYYTKIVVLFFSVITVSLLFLMFIFVWQQNEFNEKERLDFDLNSFSRFTQILEKKVLSDVSNLMYNGVMDILPLNTLSDYGVSNPFIYSRNPFDTTLSYQKRLSQLQNIYPYITSIDLYHYQFDTYISSSGGVFYHADEHRNDLENLVPYYILDALKVSENSRMWFSPAQNRKFTPYAGIASSVQRLPLFRSPNSNDVVFIINIDPAVLYNEYFKNQILYNSHFYIIDQDSNIIMKTSPEEHLLTALSKNNLSEKVKAHPTGADKFIYEKAEYNIIWQSSDVSNWEYIYLSKKPSTFLRLTSSLRFVFVWFIIVFIACLALTLGAGRLIYRPIDTLLKYANSVLRSPDNNKKGDIEEITNAFTSINNQLMQYKGAIDKNSSLLLHNIAISLLDGNVRDIGELNSWLSILNMKFEHTGFFFFVVKIDSEIYESMNNQKRDFFLLYIREQVEDYYGYGSANTLKFISCYRQDGIIPFILNFDVTQYAKEKSALSIILSNMNEDISNCISIAVSKPITGFEEFVSEYKKVLSYFKYVFIYGNKSIFDREQVEAFDNNLGIYDATFKKHFKDLLKLCKYEELKAEIVEFYRQAKQKNYSYLYLHTLSTEIIGIIINEFQNNDISLPSLGDGDLVASFSKLTSIERCADWYANIIDYYAEAMQSKSLLIDSKYMQAILQYIDEDIKNVTLNSVAEKFKISTGHFSRMFKKQMGMNFSDYATEKRLEHAAYLLVSTDMKISDVVCTMGYLNINYFNKIFKLKYSITPSQYRKQYSITNAS